MRKYIVGFFATIGVVVVLTGLCALIYQWKGRDSVPRKVILEADFEAGVTEYVPDDAVAKLMAGRQPLLRDIVEALERAATDKRVVGFIARIGGAKLRLADAQELRDAVATFRHAGKRAVAFAETFGEDGAANGAYFLATGFDEIVVQPSGDVGLTGVLYEPRFLRGTLDKLGFEPRFSQRYEYKNAMNLLTEKGFTPAHREAMTRLMQSQFSQLVRGIAQGRGLSEDDVRSLIDGGPFLAKEALDARLVDRLAYRDELYANEKERAGKGVKLLYLEKYLERAGHPHEKGKTIALIYGVGGVKRGKSGYDPVFGDVTMGADTMAGAFREAVEDKDVKAILFRINSPGGSYVASDTIWREVVHAREAGKPVVVSMGAVAGSGGYYVAMPADRIVAQPATVTGSIGVLAGKFVTTNFWDKLGISWDEVHSSSNAMVFTGLRDYSPEQRARFEGWLDQIYEDFTNKVADGRKLPKQRVLEIAKGRIWTGEDAKELGLVDELGGFATALRAVREVAGMSADEKIRLKEFPASKSALKLLLGKSPDSSEKAASAATLARGLELLQPVGRAARELGIVSEPDVLRMPEFADGF
jgi:protease-4